MPDNVGVAPQAETLQVPNTEYRRPENPMEKLKAKAVIGIHDEVKLTGSQGAPAVPRPLVATYNADSPQEATGAPESHDLQPVQPAPPPEIKGNPYARIRVLEREREIERKRARELEDQVGLLAKVVEKAGLVNDEEEEEEEEPLDPISRLAKETRETREEVQGWREEQEQKEANAQMRQVIGRANEQIQHFAAQADKIKPGLYTEAIAHLANVKMAEILEDDESITEDAAAAKVAEWANNIRLKAVRDGKNPGEEFMRRSVLHGFKLPPQQAQSQAPRQDDATAKIQKEKARKESLGSISTVQGSPVNDPLRATAGMSEKDRVRAIMQSQREKGQFRRSAPLMETIGHKIRR